ncbi:MAG: hypothetical protein OEQ12_01365 [Nitrosopumilus sp.]|nr:hypothetical protein [Nitrosopumilus sp.]
MVFMLIFSPFLSPSYAQISNQRIPASSTEIISLGPLEIQLTYSLDIDIAMPKKITAGNTEEVRITPSNGMLDTTFFFNGESYGPYSNSIGLGEEKDIAIDVPILNVYAKPEINAHPMVKGPASVSPDLLQFNTTTTKSVQIHVNDNIGTNNSIDLQIPITLFLEVGAELDILLASKTYPVETFEINRFTTISSYIPIEKFVYTNLNLEVDESSKEQYIKINPIVTLGKTTLYDYPVNIYIDDKLIQTVQSSRWSGDILLGYETHSVKAEFTQTQDKSNSAIIYLESIDFESVSLKKPTSLSTTDSGNLQCGSGTHEENGQCVADGLFGGGCLIATATYGSELAPQVQNLREIRDNQFLGTESGMNFINFFNEFYYSFSPAIADYERENPVFREAVKLALTPMISSLSILNHVDMDSEAEMLGYGFSLILLNVGMYFVAPAVVIIGIKKKFFYFLTLD